MAEADLRRVDNRGRVTIPALAGMTVLIERVSETEYRIRKAQVIPEEEITFLEEKPIVLSARDSRLFLAALDRPPRKPNAALRRAANRYKKRYG